MPPTETVDAPLVDQLRDKRRAERGDLAALIEARETARAAFEARTDATDEDRAAFVTAEEVHAEDVAKRQRVIRSLGRRIDEEKVLEQRRRSAARAAARLTVPAGDGVRSEPLTYRSDNAMKAGGQTGVSYFADLGLVQLASKGAGGLFKHTTLAAAEARLTQHSREMAVEVPKIEAKRTAESRKRLDASLERRLRMKGYDDPFRRDNSASPFTVEQRITPNRTDGYGGYFIPPQWLDEFIRGLRPGRVTAQLFRNMDMPSGTDVIVVPKLSTLTTVDIQGNDNNPVSNTDWTDTAVVAQVKTIAGYSDIGIQLLEQSPYAIDQMVIQDLLADYDKKVDFQLVQGAGSSSATYTPTPGGALVGLYSSAGASNWTSYNAVTYTDASPSAYKFVSVTGAMASKIATNRFLVDNTFNVVVHPRRAWWYASGVDGNNRPLVEPTRFGPFNVAALEPDSVPAEGRVAQLPWGPGLYASANVPVADTAGGGTAQDVAIGFLGSDAYFFEGQMHTDVFPEVLSGTLGIRYRVYGYVASLLRYGQALAIASGSGFAAPTGAVSSITY